MTHYTTDYSKSPAPAFDAVQDIKEYLGDHYDFIALDIRKVKDPRMFNLACTLAGIEGYPVVAWYEHFHGQGTWVEPEGIKIIKKGE
jgi:hypothetical protein